MHLRVTEQPFITLVQLQDVQDTFSRLSEKPACRLRDPLALDILSVNTQTLYNNTGQPLKNLSYCFYLIHMCAFPKIVVSPTSFAH